MALSEHSNNKFEKWKRPLNLNLLQIEYLIFQNTSMDIYHTVFQSILVPVIRIFGVTKDGSSVCCHVHDFKPYIYATIPIKFDYKHCRQVQEIVNRSLKFSKYQTGTLRNGNPTINCIYSVELLSKNNLFGYTKDFNSRRYIKVTFSSHLITANIKSMLENDGIVLSDIGRIKFQVFDSDVDLLLRFMTDIKVFSFGWIKIKKSLFSIRDSFSSRFRPKVTNCHIEVDITCSGIVCHTSSEFAPLRISSVDIECKPRPDEFVKPYIDPIIQIGNAIEIYGSSSRDKIIFVVGTCADIDGAVIFSYEDERTMLMEWRNFILIVDPDILTGYNINNFDIWYLLCRANFIGLQPFRIIGRDVATQSIPKENDQAWNKKNKVYDISGRQIIDLFLIITKEYKLESYTLGAVCLHFLNEGKDDVRVHEIARLQDGNANTRSKLAHYCLRDSELCLKLTKHLDVIEKYSALTQVLGLSLLDVLFKTEHELTYLLLFKKASLMGYILTSKFEERPISDIKEYPMLFKIVPGFYERPIAELKVPFILATTIVKYNLCITTRLQIGEAYKLSLDDWIRTPAETFFLKDSKRKGLIPSLLCDLLQLSPVEDSFRHNAIATVINSVYKFIQSQAYRSIFMEICQSVNAYTKEMLDYVQNEIVSKKGIIISITNENVLIDFDVQDVASCFTRANALCSHINQNDCLVSKCNVCVVYYPLLVINYESKVGLKFNKSHGLGNWYHAGLAHISNSLTCKLVPKTIFECLQYIILYKDKEGMVNYYKKLCSQLYKNEIDVSDLSMSKELKKCDALSESAHVEVAKKIHARNPNIVVTGQRIYYVYVNMNGRPEPEEANYACQNNILIDARYYVKQMEKCMLWVFQPVFGDGIRSVLFDML